MKRYMKSEMPYRGVQTPLLRRFCKDVFRRHPIPGKEDWQAAVLDLWGNASYREERYAALELAGAKRYEPFRTLDTRSLCEEMIVTGAWWDHVDSLSLSHRLRQLLEKYPAELSREMRAWSRDRDMWKRRSSIICQLNRKSDIDLALLFDCIDPNLSDPDFFIRKDIGWALRSLAWTDLETVEELHISQPEPDKPPKPPRGSKERPEHSPFRTGLTTVNRRHTNRRFLLRKPF